MELKATRPAQYSRSPLARSFQTITMAMQRASPIRINPTIYSWCPDKKAMASPNIRTGPMIQFCTSERARTLTSRKTKPSFSYLTLASGGYIIRIRPAAMGMLVVPTEKRLMKFLTSGIR